MVSATLDWALSVLAFGKMYGRCVAKAKVLYPSHCPNVWFVAAESSACGSLTRVPLCSP